MNGAPHLDADEFRRLGHRAIDWIADYWAGVGSRPVLSPVAPGDIARRLPDAAPDRGEPFDLLLDDLTGLLDGVTHWQHPRFFGYFPANSSPAAVLADLLSSGIGAQGMLWTTSPTLTEVEQVVTDWLATAMGLPTDFTHAAGGPGGGVIGDTASTGTMTALLAALHRASGGRYRDVGSAGTRYTVYASTQAHSSVLKATILTGLGQAALRLVDVDPATQRLDVDALRALIAEDVAGGAVPVMIVAAVGTTSTGAIDPTDEMADIAAQFDCWLHVDAAWAGVAAICPEHRSVLAGVERADSVVTNPHKWLLTTFDCSVMWVRDRAPLVGAMSVLPEYLRNAASDSGEVVDYRDWHPQLGRRFRALKLWAVLRTYGVRGLRAHLRTSIAQAARFEQALTGDNRFELLVPRSLSLVVFALAKEATTRAVLERVNNSGAAFLTHTVVEGRFALRLATGGWLTTDADIDQAWDVIRSAADAEGTS